MLRRMLALLRREDGATSVEYAAMAGLIAAVVAVSVGILGTVVNGLFLTVAGLFP